MPTDGSHLDLRPDGETGRVVASAPRRSRAGGFLTGLSTLIVVGALAVGGLLFAVQQFDLNPFATKRIDRSSSSLLLALEDRAQFVAAEGTFQQVIDVEYERRFRPDARTLFVAEGSVQGYVEFGALVDGAIQQRGPDAVTVSLPSPALGDVNLDLDSSYEYDVDTGSVLGFGGVEADQADVLRAAEDKISAAAAKSDLLVQAEQNARAFVTGLAEALGYTDVTIEFEPDPT